LHGLMLQVLMLLLVCLYVISLFQSTRDSLDDCLLFVL
jgi:hypothetical protein